MTETTSRTTRRLLVTGRVQGVGFRHSCVRKAHAVGVSGWVRNLPDGRVEAVVQGDPDAVAAMIEWASRGPRTAAVEHVAVEPAEGEFTGFEQLRSG